MEDRFERKEFDMPNQITNENKFGIDIGYFENEFNDNGRMLFNFLYECIERNQDSVFGTDIHRLDSFTNEQVQIVHRIIDCAKHNISILAAQFVSGEYGYEDLNG